MLFGVCLNKYVIPMDGIKNKVVRKELKRDKNIQSATKARSHKSKPIKLDNKMKKN